MYISYYILWISCKHCCRWIKCLAAIGLVKELKEKFEWRDLAWLVSNLSGWSGFFPIFSLEVLMKIARGYLLGLGVAGNKRKRHCTGTQVWNGSGMGMGHGSREDVTDHPWGAMTTGAWHFWKNPSTFMVNHHLLLEIWPFFLWFDAVDHFRQTQILRWE